MKHHGARSRRLASYPLSCVPNHSHALIRNCSDESMMPGRAPRHEAPLATARGHSAVPWAVPARVRTPPYRGHGRAPASWNAGMTPVSTSDNTSGLASQRSNRALSQRQLCNGCELGACRRLRHRRFLRNGPVRISGRRPARVDRGAGTRAQCMCTRRSSAGTVHVHSVQLHAAGHPPADVNGSSTRTAGRTGAGTA